MAEISTREVLNAKIVATGLYDRPRAEELTARIAHDEAAMLTLIGRLVVEAERGGSGIQQGIRALVNTGVVPSTLDTFNVLETHELSDEAFPVVTPPKDD